MDETSDDTVAYNITFSASWISQQDFKTQSSSTLALRLLPPSAFASSSGSSRSNSSNNNVPFEFTFRIFSNNNDICKTHHTGYPYRSTVGLYSDGVFSPPVVSESCSVDPSLGVQQLSIHVCDPSTISSGSSGSANAAITCHATGKPYRHPLVFIPIHAGKQLRTVKKAYLVVRTQLWYRLDVVLSRSSPLHAYINEHGYKWDTSLSHKSTNKSVKHDRSYCPIRECVLNDAYQLGHILQIPVPNQEPIAKSASKKSSNKSSSSSSSLTSQLLRNSRPSPSHSNSHNNNHTNALSPLSDAVSPRSPSSLPGLSPASPDMGASTGTHSSGSTGGHSPNSNAGSPAPIYHSMSLPHQQHYQLTPPQAAGLPALLASALLNDPSLLGKRKDNPIADDDEENTRQAKRAMSAIYYMAKMAGSLPSLSAPSQQQQQHNLHVQLQNAHAYHSYATSRSPPTPLSPPETPSPPLSLQLQQQLHQQLLQQQLLQQQQQQGNALQQPALTRTSSMSPPNTVSPLGSQHSGSGSGGQVLFANGGAGLVTVSPPNPLSPIFARSTSAQAFAPAAPSSGPSSLSNSNHNNNSYLLAQLSNTLSANSPPLQLSLLQQQQQHQRQHQAQQQQQQQSQMSSYVLPVLSMSQQQQLLDTMASSAAATMTTMSGSPQSTLPAPISAVKRELSTTSVSSTHSVHAHNTQQQQQQQPQYQQQSNTASTYLNPNMSNMNMGMSTPYPSTQPIKNDMFATSMNMNLSGMGGMTSMNSYSSGGGATFDDLLGSFPDLTADHKDILPALPSFFDTCDKVPLVESLSGFDNVAALEDSVLFRSGPPELHVLAAASSVKLEMTTFSSNTNTTTATSTTTASTTSTSSTPMTPKDTMSPKPMDLSQDGPTSAANAVNTTNTTNTSSTNSGIVISTMTDGTPSTTTPAPSASSASASASTTGSGGNSARAVALTNQLFALVKQTIKETSGDWSSKLSAVLQRMSSSGWVTQARSFVHDQEAEASRLAKTKEDIVRTWVANEKKRGVKWPHSPEIRTLLEQAGFEYRPTAFIRDRCQCVHCGHTYAGYQAWHDPDMLRRLHKPNCPSLSKVTAKA